MYRKRKRIINKISDYDEIPFHSYKNEQDICKVIKCYDGDSIHIIRMIGKIPYRFRCRLSGIDTAEIRSKNIEEKKFAIKTRDYLANLILNQYVWITFGEFDKYGRLLCTIYLTHKDTKHNHSINERLIEEGYAQPYNGDTKLDFANWNKPQSADVLV